MKSVGRGCGRGRGNLNKQNIPWSSNNVPWSPQKDNGEERKTTLKGAKVVNEHDVLREKMVKMAAMYSDLNDSDDTSEEEIHDEEIVTKTIQQYQEVLQDDEENKENQFLLDVLQSGAISCLVCIENVKRLDAVWSCELCSCIFHLQCIQKWAREGVGRIALSMDGEISQQDLIWHCPKCRHEYKQVECPTKYLCFCSKEENPPFDPWIVPHSCGQRCERPLLPVCGHECLLLCHPGLCPPCPKTVNTKCHCGRGGPALRRCSKKAWSCGKTCRRALLCGHHTCQEFCHSGNCPPCPNTSDQFCMCGKKKSTRECAHPEWSCDQTCGKALSCGHHLCEKQCHPGSCGECPRSGNRTCPCGKSASTLPCTEDVPPCQDTCSKQLTCGIHDCSKRCHYGPCDTCFQVLEKTCRCGRRRKEVPCSQLFSCDLKCVNTRTCGRHACKRKCCNGRCPPCEQICNRTLNCRNHKCPSPCHQGMCYPCPLSKKVTCYCGGTSITVPCGKEKATKPPRCKQYCKIPSDCHHETQKPHRCHYSRCPPCAFMCEKQLSFCQHGCQEICHDHVFDKKASEQNMLRTSNKKTDTRVFVSLPCPPCRFPVEKLCLGEHAIEEFPCSELKPYSCKGACGRLLACENHLCRRECHVVKGHPEDGKAGRNCITCEELCLKPRPEGCIHDCKLPCHPGSCPECVVHLKLECHCKSIQIYVKCSEYNHSNEETKDSLLCCKTRCPKLMSCGHVCPKICHKDACSGKDECVETTNIKCSCGRRKKAFHCPEARRGYAKLECDERCNEVKEKKRKEKLGKEEANKTAEMKKQQEELEWFERKKHVRKRKQRRVTETEQQDSFFVKYKVWIMLGVAALILGVFAANVLSK